MTTNRVIHEKKKSDHFKRNLANYIVMIYKPDCLIHIISHLVMHCKNNEMLTLFFRLKNYTGWLTDTSGGKASPEGTRTTVKKPSKNLEVRTRQ